MGVAGTVVPQAEPRLWDGLLVVCAANKYDGIKLADQHIAEQLSKLGPVLYVDPPVSPVTSLRKREVAHSLEGPRLRLEAPGLARLTPVVQPFPSRRGMAGVTTALIARYLRRAVSRLGGQVRAVISAWPQYPVFGSCGEEVRVYWAQDDFVGGADLLGLNAKLIDMRERRVASTADLIIAANPVVAGAWRDRGCSRLSSPSGQTYLRTATLSKRPCLQMSTCRRLSWGSSARSTSVRTFACLKPSLTGGDRFLVGPVNPRFEPQRFDALRWRENVCWVGRKPFEALPGYLRLIDVGIVPYRDSPLNRGSFPLKTLEYLAAGRGVVATDLPAIRWLATDLVSVAVTPEHFANEVDRLLGEPRTRALMAGRQAFAAQHSWAHRAAAIRAAIAGHEPLAAVGR